MPGWLKFLLKGLGFCLVGLTLLFMIFLIFNFAGFIFLILLGAFYCWIGFAFFHYRYVRQEEVLALLQSAVEGGNPVAPALRAYLADRPVGWTRESLIAVGMFLIFPGYYWIWHRGKDFDSRLQHLIELLESGYSLSESLQLIPSLVSRDVLLAVSLGESSGKIAQTIQAVPRWKQDQFWLTTLPRIAYVLAVVSFTMIVVGFFMVYILPRFKRIFHEFNLQLPGFSNRVFEFAEMIFGTPIPLILFILVSALFFLVPIWSRSVRWHLPVIGSIYKIQVQGNFLRMLGLALQSQETLNKTIIVLGNSGYFPGPALKNLAGLIDHVEKGGSLSSGLVQFHWVPESMKALVESAEHLGNLPWALMEAGLQRARVASFIANRITFTLFPLVLLGLGAMVGIFAVGMFLPLVQLIMELA